MSRLYRELMQQWQFDIIGSLQTGMNSHLFEWSTFTDDSFAQGNYAIIRLKGITRSEHPFIKRFCHVFDAPDLRFQVLGLSISKNV